MVKQAAVGTANSTSICSRASSSWANGRMGKWARLAMAWIANREGGVDIVDGVVGGRHSQKAEAGGYDGAERRGTRKTAVTTTNSSNSTNNVLGKRCCTGTPDSGVGPGERTGKQRPAASEKLRKGRGGEKTPAVGLQPLFARLGAASATSEGLGRRRGGLLLGIRCSPACRPAHTWRTACDGDAWRSTRHAETSGRRTTCARRGRTGTGRGEAGRR